MSKFDFQNFDDFGDIQNMSSDFIIHFGRRLSAFTYDHNIDKRAWDELLDYVESNQQFQIITQNKKYKLYQLNSLTYEFDINSPEKYQCWTDTINSINYVKIKHALSYQRYRETYNYDFQPINNYYNIHEVVRHIYTVNGSSVVFEKKNNTHEIMVIYHDNYDKFVTNPLNKCVLQFIDIIDEFCKNEK